MSHWTIDDLRSYTQRRLRHEERARTEMATQSTDKLIETLRKAPIMQCYSMHECCLCKNKIALGEQYRDGGYGRRAHIGCVNLGEPAARLVDHSASGSVTGLETSPQGGLTTYPCAGSPKSSKSHGAKYSVKIVLAFFAECGLAEPVPEFRFDPERRWRSDFSWPSQKLCLEIQGGLWTQGAHVRGAHLLKEMEKLNRLAVLGWRVLFVTPDQLTTLDTINLIRDALKTQ